MAAGGGNRLSAGSAPARTTSDTKDRVRSSKLVLGERRSDETVVHQSLSLSTRQPAWWVVEQAACSMILIEQQ